MDTHLLKTADIPDVPKSIEVLQDFGMVQIHDDTGHYITGEHLALRGAPEAIAAWLRPLQGVWVGVGSPMMQEFEIMHIK